ncbi:MAG: hypothetical protein AB2570_20035 [Candidatus Thiodiazotropha endolucinida]
MPQSNKLLACILCAGSDFRGFGSCLPKGGRCVFVELGLSPCGENNSNKLLAHLLCIGSSFRGFGSGFL